MNNLLPKPKHKKSAEKKLLARSKGKRDSIKPKIDVKKFGSKKTDLFKNH